MSSIYNGERGSEGNRGPKIEEVDLKKGKELLCVLSYIIVFQK